MNEIIHFRGGPIDGYVTPDPQTDVSSAHVEWSWYDRVPGSERVEDGVTHVDLAYRSEGMSKRAARRLAKRKGSV